MRKTSHNSIENVSSLDSSRLPDDGGPDYNRLVFEKSPYLLQHATNPVDWHPWNNKSLDLARKKDLPIFLSIGYSTCHWCHVMADESFTDPLAAKIINQSFIPIKVDREERPDIDNTYMQACQMMTGSGGWPLTIVMTPDLLPFFAATYIPKNDRDGMIGLCSLLSRIADLWQNNRQAITSSGNKVFDILQKYDQVPAAGGSPDTTTLTDAISDYIKQFDPIHGGFGPAPKFPAPHNLSLLIRLGHHFSDPKATEMALDTLRAIRFGGIYDQLGGGIHRYSVDERWLVPHFEKMLYDQALLIQAATDAWQASGDVFFHDMAVDTAGYVLRDLTSSSGGFFCGEDADSEGEEGTFYLWQIEEIEQSLGAEQAADIIRMFGATSAGNFEGGNILHLPEGLEHERLEVARKKLFPRRQLRIRPHLDDKVITSWNGLAIAALARLGALSGTPEFVRCAAQCLDFVKSNLVNDKGRLLRRWRNGEAAIPAFLEDYAFLIWGLIELYQARFMREDLDLALHLAEKMMELFSDAQGGLYDTGHDTEKILVRGRTLQDGALPSGNGAAALVLLRLGLMTGREDIWAAGESAVRKNFGVVRKHPTAFSVSMMAIDTLLGPSAGVVLVGKEETKEFVGIIRRRFRPGLELLWKKPDDRDIDMLAPLAVGKKEIGQRTTAWLCRDRSCQPPVTDPDKLADLLAGL